MPETLSAEERDLILKMARQTLGQGLRQEALPTIDLAGLPPRLRSPGACFVTLTLHDRLRGCVGTLEPVNSLAEDVCTNTVAAAFSDPRFPSLELHEYEAVRIEIACLTALNPLVYDNPDNLLAQLHPGVDGVLIRDGLRRATFLPKVWEKIPDPEQFLGLLCQKMGVESDHWRWHPMQVFTYQAETFGE